MMNQILDVPKSGLNMQPLMKHSCFLMVEPSQDKDLLLEAENYCKEKMPRAKIFRSCIAGIPSVLEQVLEGDDFFVYLPAAPYRLTDNMYSPRVHYPAIDLIPKVNCKVFAVAVPRQYHPNYDFLPESETVEVAEILRNMNVLIPSSKSRQQDTLVQGWRPYTNCDAGNVHFVFQYMVMKSTVELIYRETVRLNQPQMAISDWSMHPSIMEIVERYTPLLDEKALQYLHKEFQ